MSAITRGLIAGAVGTVVLTAVTYLDMAVRGRPASSVPGDAIDALGVSLPGSGAAQDNRREAVAALTGIGVGLGAGVAAALVRAAGFRPGPVLIGAATMAATDVPLVRLGVTDPRQWTVADWAADVVPHLAYGAAVHGTLALLDDEPSRAVPLAGSCSGRWCWVGRRRRSSSGWPGRRSPAPVDRRSVRARRWPWPARSSPPSRRSPPAASSTAAPSCAPPPGSSVRPCSPREPARDRSLPPSRVPSVGLRGRTGERPGGGGPSVGSPTGRPHWPRMPWR